MKGAGDCGTNHVKIAKNMIRNAPKWSAAIEMIRLATDQDWLHKATKELAKHWKNKRERCQQTIY
jgi:hypothetical protein